MRNFGTSEMFSLLRETKALGQKTFEPREIVDLTVHGPNIWAVLDEGSSVLIVEDSKATDALYALAEQLSSFFSVSGESQGSNLMILEGTVSPWSRALLYGEVANLLDAASAEHSFSDILWESFVNSLPEGFGVAAADQGFLLVETTKRGVKK